MSTKSSLRKGANNVFRSSAPRPGNKRRTVLQITTTWKANLDNLGRETENMAACLAGEPWVRRAMHADRMLAFVVVTEKNTAQLYDLISEAAARTGLLDRVWIQPASEGIYCNMPMDALTEYVHQAWALVHDHNNPPRRPTPDEIVRRHLEPGADLRTALRDSLKTKKKA